MDKENEFEKKIIEIHKHHRPVCIFGTGKMGTVIGYSYIQMLVSKGLKINFFCDNDRSKWGKEIKDGLICISPSELYALDNPFVFLFISTKSSKPVEQQLKKENIEYITVYELARLDFWVDIFLESGEVSPISEPHILPSEYQIQPIGNPENKQVAVYTCICGGYDEVLEPLYINEQCDYYIITDRKPSETSKWKYIDIFDILPSFELDNVRKNRFCKIHGCEIFLDYAYSIYIDGNMLLTGDVMQYVKTVGRSGIGMFRMPKEGGDCLYLHGVKMAGIKAPENVVRAQLREYMRQGMPRHFGLYECNFIVRNNQNALTQKIMRDWWREVYEKSFRDQISFTYVLWKNGLTCDDVGCLGNNVREIGEISRTSHDIRTT
ncbi:Protein of unknown function [Lachnospiraceae bacterium XBB2008]|nr:Protein of unknown function [Lachnospiraceae bacterium XBB2008]